MSLSRVLVVSSNLLQLEKYFLLCKQKYLSTLCAAGAIVLWASGPAAVKCTLTDVSLGSLQFFGSALATLFLLCTIILTKEIKELLQVTAKQLLLMFLLGGLGVFAYLRLLYECIALMPVQEAQVLNYLWPALTVVFSCLFFAERLTLPSLLCLVLSFLGAMIAIGGSGGILSIGSSIRPGFLCGLGAAVAYASYSTISKMLRLHRLVVGFYAYFFGTMLSGLLLLGDPTSTLSITAKNLPGILWIGIGCYGIAGILWLIALEHGQTDKLATAVYLTPCISFIFIYLLVGEKIAATSIYGIALIIMSSLAQWAYNQRLLVAKAYASN